VQNFGISQAWGQACSVLGSIEALAALAAIAARHAAGKIQSPGGMLRAMTPTGYPARLLSVIYCLATQGVAGANTAMTRGNGK
jgi:hypothetical protein